MSNKYWIIQSGDHVYSGEMPSGQAHRFPTRSNADAKARNLAEKSGGNRTYAVLEVVGLYQATQLVNEVIL